MANNYVNNEQFMEALVEYKKKLETNPEAQIPEYIGKCILDIATRFSTRPNFYSYPFREEMIGDAVENCLRYLTSYDAEKGKNPFSYFTQVCFYAFLRRIQKEKKQGYIKHKLLLDMPFEAFEMQDHDEGSMTNMQELEMARSTSFFDAESFERSLEKKKKKTNATVEDLIDDILGEENDTEAS